MPGSSEESIAHLNRVLDLKQVGTDRFEAITEQQEGRLFGGLALAQSIVAAGRTVESGTIHSMHGYFLRAGRPAKPIVYQVERIRDGRNFTGRRVSGYQDGTDMIFEASISFTAPEEGTAYQVPMPPADGPDGMVEYWKEMGPGAEDDQQRERRGGGGPRRWLNPIEIVSGEAGGSRRPISERLPQRKVWGRPAGPLPEDPIIHAAAIAYYSDSGMVATVASVLGNWQPGGATASLDHSIWWHHPPRFDDWLLYDTKSEVGLSARGLIWGGMYTRDGVRVVSVAQEGLFRTPKPPANQQ